MNIAVLVDIGVVLVLLVSAGVSFFRGFIREILTVFGVFGGALAAFTMGPHLQPLMADLFGVSGVKDPGKFFDVLPKTLAADMAAYVAVFLIVFIVLQLLSHFLSATVRALGLGPVDRTLGIFFGLARGVLLLGILYLPFNLILPESNKKEWLETSKTIFFVEQVSDYLSSFLPQDKKDKSKDDVETSTRDKLKEIDVLGNKRITDAAKDAVKEITKGGTEALPIDRNSPSDGYDDKVRDELKKIILDNELQKSDDTQPVKGTQNE